MFCWYLWYFMNTRARLAEVTYTYSWYVVISPRRLLTPCPFQDCTVFNVLNIQCIETMYWHNSLHILVSILLLFLLLYTYLFVDNHIFSKMETDKCLFIIEIDLHRNFYGFVNLQIDLFETTYICNFTFRCVLLLVDTKANHENHNNWNHMK